jgi:hypothetical protein
MEEDGKKEKRNPADHLKKYRWPPGFCPNKKGRPPDSQLLRGYLRDVAFEFPISPALYREAMNLLGVFAKELRAIKKLIKDGAEEDSDNVMALVPKRVKKLSMGQFNAIKALSAGAGDSDLYLKIIDQIHGKPTQPMSGPEGGPIPLDVVVAGKVAVYLPDNGRSELKKKEEENK